MYEPYTWTTGEVITAEKLNNLEQGVGDSCQILRVEQVFNEQTGEPIGLNHTVQEIVDAYTAGIVPLLFMTDGVMVISPSSSVVGAPAYINFYAVGHVAGAEGDGTIAFSVLNYKADGTLTWYSASLPALPDD